MHALFGGLFLFASLVGAVFVPAPAAASAPTPFAADHAVRARLLLEKTVVHRGRAVEAVIELTPAAGWHLYGPEHGDAGQPPSIKWALTDDVHAGKIRWPPSTRVVANGLTTYEYTGRTELRVPLTLVQRAEPREGVPIRADVSWIACFHVCVPGHAQLTTALTIIPGTGQIWSVTPYLGLAFFGGLLLNLMPCVFPVLSFKALRTIGEPVGRRGQTAVAYMSGVMCSCGMLGAALLAARAAGAGIGWGFQLQSPPFMAFPALLLAVLGLAMSGAIELALPVPPHLARRAAAAGPFGDGVLVTLIASTCIGPYMGAALSFALSTSTPVALGIFLMLGLGLALPQGVLMVAPALLLWLPWPGAWLLVARRVLAIPLYVSAAWLAWIFVQQVAPATVIGKAAVPPATAFSTARLAELRRKHELVLVDVSAAWCITCQVNERFALDRPSVTRELEKLHVTVLRADWTTQDAQLTSYLRSLGSAGVPLYALYARNETVDVWPQLLTPKAIIDRLHRAERFAVPYSVQVALPEMLTYAE